MTSKRHRPLNLYGYAVYDPQGRVMRETAREERYQVRRDFAREQRRKWNYFWRQGYKVHAVERIT